MIDVVETPLDCVRGDDNVYDIDITTPIVQASDKIWFTAKRRQSDTDADAVIKKGLNAGTGYTTGVVVTSEANGQFQVTLDAADTDSLTDKALLYDVQIKQTAGGKVRTVARGILLLSGEVTEATS